MAVGVTSRATWASAPAATPTPVAAAGSDPRCCAAARPPGSLEYVRPGSLPVTPEADHARPLGLEPADGLVGRCRAAYGRAARRRRGLASRRNAQSARLGREGREGGRLSAAMLRAREPTITGRPCESHLPGGPPPALASAPRSRASSDQPRRGGRPAATRPPGTLSSSMSPSSNGHLLSLDDDRAERAILPRIGPRGRSQLLLPQLGEVLVGRVLLGRVRRHWTHVLDGLAR